MADLTAAKRRKLPASEFAGKKGSGEEFPIPDKKHARLAISGATRAERAGNISESKEASIKAQARKKLGGGKKSVPHGHKHGKGSTNRFDHYAMSRD